MLRSVLSILSRVVSMLKRVVSMLRNLMSITSLFITHHPIIEEI